MAIVFVHGVANRTDPKKDPGVKVRDGLFTSVSLSNFGPEVLSPYWGQFGAFPSRKLAAIPNVRAGEEFGITESFGIAGRPDLIVALDGHIALEAPEQTQLLTLARTDQAMFVNLLGVMLASSGEIDAEELMELHRLGEQPWEWLGPIKDDAELKTLLPQKLKTEKKEGETFGGPTDLLGKVREGFDHVKNAALRSASIGAVKAFRRGLTTQVVDFLGDIFLYQKDPGPNGPIGKEIMTSLLAAHEKAEPIAVIGHSMGGNVVLDLLTGYPEAFPDDFKIDLLVTAGNQVAVFEEIGALQANSTWPAGAPGKLPAKRPKPAQVTRWINVYDDADILGFKAQESFEDVEDFNFDTGGNLATAHSAYFLVPRWHERLKARTRG